MGHVRRDSEGLPINKLFWAVVINVILTVFQIIGGLLSGSLSLLADALHNFSDAGALVIAAVAAKISKIPANKEMTFGYRRAEIIGALINSTTLIVVGIYLIYESIIRYQDQIPINGWLVVIVATIALLIDLLTALLTYSGSKTSINIRAAFIHNLSDAMSSVVVIVSGALIMLYKVYVIDLIATGIIAIYVLYHAVIIIKQCVRILMHSVPEGLNVDEIRGQLNEISQIISSHHIHVWQLDDRKIFLECHIVIDEKDLSYMEKIKADIRKFLFQQYSIEHTTLEIEVGKECSNK